MTKKRGEFEDRNKQLPASKPISGLYQSGIKVHEARNAPDGAPVVGFDVRSTFDSRPVQGIDSTVSDLTSSSAPVSSSYIIVPGGYMFVLREIFVVFSAGLQSPFQFAGWFTHNGAAVQTMLTRDYGVSAAINRFYVRSGETYKTFLLADEGDTIGMSIVNVEGDLISQQIMYTYNGNLLQKTGVAYTLEIANKLR